uniref:Uncharacterized protein n=1 Tax=Anguilla anguilla TaxID=7936 RepID=A0A0E9PZ60_ANGAN
MIISKIVDDTYIMPCSANECSNDSEREGKDTEKEFPKTIP